MTSTYYIESYTLQNDCANATARHVSWPRFRRGHRGRNPEKILDAILLRWIYHLSLPRLRGCLGICLGSVLVDTYGE